MLFFRILLCCWFYYYFSNVVAKSSHLGFPEKRIRCAPGGWGCAPKGVCLGAEVRPPAGWGGGEEVCFSFFFPGFRKWLKPTKINSPENKENVRRPPTGWGGNPHRNINERRP